ncbi:hypothetical protein F0231_07110 [Vibrio sp. RE86]|nr:hypothetical protein [Vibrio sp. RE86]
MSIPVFGELLKVIALGNIASFYVIVLFLIVYFKFILWAFAKPIFNEALEEFGHLLNSLDSRLGKKEEPNGEQRSTQD